MHPGHRRHLPRGGVAVAGANSPPPGGLPVGVVAFTVAATGFALGVSTVVVVLGLPVLVGTLAVARGFARGEWARVAAMTGRAVLEPVHRTPGREGGGVERMLRALRDGQSWRDLAHLR
ncbi:sensor domain-containing protein [Streptomyces sp. A73]|nr:sensor domain-containing protein [Streptomyces sp. A73]